jgi:hypothetical protein
MITQDVLVRFSKELKHYYCHYNLYLSVMCVKARVWEFYRYSTSPETGEPKPAFVYNNNNNNDNNNNNNNHNLFNLSFLYTF